MTHDPRDLADSTNGIQFADQEPSAPATSLFTEPPKLTQVAQTLAAHGGGALSLDLALDIVLNDIVQQASNATGATGAAIALFRDGELVCRATAGENAPDLGMRVDAHSGLAGACVSTGEIQQCQDTDIDGRVNAETCRQLGVRSMLIAPLVDGQRLVGILQVFSAWPNAFGKREITALQVLAGRIAESNREAETGISMPAINSELPAEPATITEEPFRQAEDPTPPFATESESNVSESLEPGPIKSESTESEPRRRVDIWGAVLIILVIAAALALGLVIGWRKAAEFSNRSGPVRSSSTANVSAIAETPVASNPSNADDSSSSAPSRTVPTRKAAADAPPVGGLVVTQGGKVIYRSSSGRAHPSANESAARSLVHRVDPEYPAEAKARQVQGPVVLDVVVLGDGGVGSVAVVSGDPLLTQSAIDAVKQWRYQPEAPNGQGLERRGRITINFKLPQS